MNNRLEVIPGVNTLLFKDGMSVLVSQEDYPSASKFRWHPNRHDDGRIYLMTGSPATKKAPTWALALHRFLTDAPKGTHVDHRNGDTLDNTRGNLRVCTPSQNFQNKRKSWGRSKYKGVCWCKHKERWKASIKTTTVRIQRYFVDEKDAARAYDRIALEHFGEFACTNAEMFGDLT